MRVELTVNGEARTVAVEPRTSLLDCLRDELLLTGAHAGCEHGVCGACTVLVDGTPVRASCQTGKRTAVRQPAAGSVVIIGPMKKSAAAISATVPPSR